MNKYLILLGIVLLASLSFAADGPENWMQSVQGRYFCSYEYNYYMLELIGPECKTISEGEYYGLMEEYFYYDMVEGSLYSATYDMGLAAGCGEDPPDVSWFRGEMGFFNTEAFAFKQIFLSNIRACLAGTVRCDCSEELSNQQYILQYLAEANSIQKSCLAGGEGHLPYCMKPERGETD